MPGICGIVTDLKSHPAMEVDVRRMQDAMAYETWHQRASHLDDSVGVGLGSVALECDTQHQKLAIDESTSSAIVFDGEIYNGDEPGVRLPSTNDKSVAISDAGL